MTNWTAAALAALVTLAVAPAARAAVVTLNFEGVAGYPDYDEVALGGFYDGGTSSTGRTGTNYGVSFSANAILVCLNSITVVCSDASRGGLGQPASRRGALAFNDSSPAYLNVAAGFTTGLSFNYVSVAQGGAVGVYDGPNGTGNLLASVPYIPNAAPCPGYQADSCPFAPAGVLFVGTARSVLFGNALEVAFDDVTFGSNVPGPVGASPVPLPAGLPLLAAGLGALAMLRRRARGLAA